MFILPEAVWTSPRRGSRRYRWLHDYIFGPAGGGPAWDRARIPCILGKMLLSVDEATDDPADLAKLLNASSCGVRYPMWQICDFARRLTAGSPAVLWDILARLAWRLADEDGWAVDAETYAEVAHKMSAAAHSAASSDSSFAAAVCTLELLANNAASYFPRDRAPGAHGRFFVRPSPAGDGARSRAARMHTWAPGFGATFLGGAPPAENS